MYEEDKCENCWWLFVSLAVAIILLTGGKNLMTELPVVGLRKRYIQLRRTNTMNS